MIDVNWSKLDNNRTIEMSINKKFEKKNFSSTKKLNL